MGSSRRIDDTLSGKIEDVERLTILDNRILRLEEERTIDLLGEIRNEERAIG